MKRLLSVVLPILALLCTVQTVCAVDPRAQEVMDSARAAIGVDELQKLQSLIITGQFRRMLGERQMGGDREISIQLPDKFLVEDAINPGGMSTALILTRGLNGEHAWTASSGGGGGMFIKMGTPGGPAATPEQIEAMLRRQHQIEMIRYLLALLVTSPATQTLDYKYAGESDVDDAHADVVEITGADKFSARLFFDKQTHLPLLLSYRAPKPRIVTMTRRAGSDPEEVKKAREDAEKKMTEENARPEEVDFFIRLSDQKKEGGLTLPHKLTFLAETEVSEEFEISKYKLNPQFKTDKFQKH